MSYIVLTSFRNSLLFELVYHNSPKVHYFMADKLENYTGFTYLWCTYRGVCWICRLRNMFRFFCMDNPCRCPEIRKRKLRNIYLFKSWQRNILLVLKVKCLYSILHARRSSRHTCFYILHIKEMKFATFNEPGNNWISSWQTFLEVLGLRVPYVLWTYRTTARSPHYHLC